jgi:hypothetical protein
LKNVTAPFTKGELSRQFHRLLLSPSIEGAGANSFKTKKGVAPCTQGDGNAHKSLMTSKYGQIDRLVKTSVPGGKWQKT